MKVNTMEDQTLTKCFTYFRMVGIFDPDTISQMLELEPEDSSKIGDIGITGIKFESADWNYGYCYDYDVDVDEQMRKTIAPLMSKIDILKKIKKSYDVDFYLEVVPTVVYGESTPCLAPSLEVMKFCCDTQTKLDIDLYVDIPDSIYANIKSDW